MTTRELTIAGLLTAVLGPGAYILGKSGEYQRVVLVEPAGKTELAGADAAAVLLDDAGQPRVFAEGSTVACKSGGYLDGVWREDREWCIALDADGKPTGQGWTRAAKGAETMTVEGGKVFVEAKVAEAEAVK